MAMTVLTSQLPGVLPDLFRKPEQAAPRPDDATPNTTTTAQQSATAAQAQADDARAQLLRTSDDTARLLARRAALGPLTYGRSMPPAATTPAAAPIGLRGAHLDVRG